MKWFWPVFFCGWVCVGCGRVPVITDPAVEVPGGRIAFIGGGEGYNFQLFVMRPDGTGLRTILPDVDPRSDFSGQAWSPDGRQLVFASNLGGNANYDIYTMDLDGGNLKRIVSDSGGDFAPSWSPDGTRILFQAKRLNATGWDIYMVGVDGSNEQNLTQTIEDEEVASWSPDGDNIVFQVAEEGGVGIYVMDADGQNRRQLVAGGDRVANETPAWSPDGRQIAFASNLHQTWDGPTQNRVAQYEIYVMNSDGSDLRRVTHIADIIHSARWPTWAPNGLTLAFELSELSEVSAETYWNLATVNVDGSNFKKIPMTRQGRLPRWGPQ